MTEEFTPPPAVARLRSKWDGGKHVFGLWAQIPAPFIAELAANVGYDYVCVDLQHGLLGSVAGPGAGPGSGRHRAARDAIARIRDAAHAHGLIAGMHCAGGQAARSRVQEGFKLVTVAVDSALLNATISGELASARGAIA